MTEETKQVSVSRRIAAPAAEIFRVLAEPRRHVELDASRMLREAVFEGALSGVGQVFTMKMHYKHLGDYEMDNHVVVFEPDQRIGWRPVAGHGHPERGSSWGQRWIFELSPDGPDATVVTQIFDLTDMAEQHRASVTHGQTWLPGMTTTLERLDTLCTGG
ncbi:SRPBCC family protein [Crossiella sp. CA198]|uniref:SRPBCC family protein n=1 Tax=Crossiella sp. CA198 TaxID=3455607 RepID=UPI003F8D67F3